GTTTVNCSATNSSNQTTTGSFHITINFTGDTTPPTIQSPGTQTATATSAAGAVVSYSATATDPDNTAGEITVVCLPASGSTFAIGTTQVTCNAHDPAGEAATPARFNAVGDDGAPVLNLPADSTPTARGPTHAPGTHPALDLD